jgi:hypothetical protein
MKKNIAEVLRVSNIRINSNSSTIINNDQVRVAIIVGMRETNRRQ